MPQSILDEVIFSFRKQKELAEKAFQQLGDAEFFRPPGQFSNSMAIILKHVAGNLRSRWTEFLTTDGEKPDRNRDGEFVLTAADTRQRLVADWDASWATLVQALAGLGDEDLTRTVTIRGEPHSVLQAALRSLTHTTYHVGQIVYLSRLLVTDGWEWITVPPGQSQAFNQTMAAGNRHYLNPSPATPGTPSGEAVGRAYLAATRAKLQACLERVRHCVGQLSDGQVWCRGGKDLNSIGNLILHLCGNVRQWIVSGVGGEPDHRDRPGEFAERALIPGAELLRRLESVVAAADRVLANTSAEALLAARRIQGFDETGLTAVFESVAHFNGHTQEIVALTRLQLGQSYRLAWEPTTAEQGAAAAPP